jgi:DNA-binding CsgD family transcriptional regulator
VSSILGIFAATVREHLAKARNLLGVRTKMQTVAIAVQRGWLVP